MLAVHCTCNQRFLAKGDNYDKGYAQSIQDSVAIIITDCTTLPGLAVCFLIICISYLKFTSSPKWNMKVANRSINQQFNWKLTYIAPARAHLKPHFQLKIKY